MLFFHSNHTSLLLHCLNSLLKNWLIIGSSCQLLQIIPSPLSLQVVVGWPRTALSQFCKESPSLPLSSDARQLVLHSPRAGSWTRPAWEVAVGQDKCVGGGRKRMKPDCQVSRSTVLSLCLPPDECKCNCSSDPLTNSLLWRGCGIWWLALGWEW